MDLKGMDARRALLAVPPDGFAARGGRLVGTQGEIDFVETDGKVHVRLRNVDVEAVFGVDDFRVSDGTLSGPADVWIRRTEC